MCQRLVSAALSLSIVHVIFFACPTWAHCRPQNPNDALTAQQLAAANIGVTPGTPGLSPPHLTAFGATNFQDDLRIFATSMEFVGFDSSSPTILGVTVIWGRGAAATEGDQEIAIATRADVAIGGKHPNLAFALSGGKEEDVPKLVSSDGEPCAHS